MKDCYIIGGLRTPIGNFGKGLASVPAPELGGILVKEFITREVCDPDQVDQAVFGNVLQAGAGMNPARQAAIKGGLPYSVPAYTVNMVCASGLYSVVLGDQAISRGQAHSVIAGGFENMSRAPRALLKSRWGNPLGHDRAVDLMLTDGLWDVFYDVHMAVTVEALVKRYEISRQAQDEFALESHKRAITAIRTGKFGDEIVPVQVKGVQVKQDERPRADTTLEKLTSLKPAFNPNGTITAGNASGLNDGAAAVVLSSEKPSLNGAIHAEIVDSALIAVDPMDMGIAPVLAIRKLLANTKLELEDVGLWEINEAFAGQMLAVLKEIPVPLDKLNVNGGAIALGHPIGCSGAKILVTLLHEMRRREVEHGVVALCVGGGLSVAVLVRYLG
ncbi:acetyl-CoA C-acyltransferase [Candidatus Bipolaricaulota bacterium]|nr:acetyl-CoA C-acyltransferase [Candidatus Bipolaricaulota bacterium]